MLCHVAAKIFKCLKVIKYGLNLLEKIRFRPVKMLSRSSIQNKDKSPNSPNNRGKSTRANWYLYSNFNTVNWLPRNKANTSFIFKN